MPSHGLGHASHDRQAGPRGRQQSDSAVSLPSPTSTHRNALCEGANRFAPSSVEPVVLSVMQSALGGRKAKGPAVAARLGPRYLQRISEAAGRLRPEIGEAQIPLPLQGD